MNKLILIVESFCTKKCFFPTQENSAQLIMSQFHPVFGVFQFRFNVPSSVVLRYLRNLSNRTSFLGSKSKIQKFFLKPNNCSFHAMPRKGACLIVLWVVWTGQRRRYRLLPPCWAVQSCCLKLQHKGCNI